MPGKINGGCGNKMTVSEAKQKALKRKMARFGIRECDFVEKFIEIV